ncbi:3'-5' exonuclease [Mangrovibacter plantisponsor]|nr:3'-5' exonuclease [Mangrovibacter plantisponsor]
MSDHPPVRQHKITPPDWPCAMETLALQTRHFALREYYKSGIVSPETPLCDVPFLAMDFETTGLNTQHDDIVSIGLIPMSLSRIRLQESQHWILNPRADLRKESVVIHGITHSKIISAPDLNEVIQQLLALMAGKVMVVHHRSIEQNFLDIALKRRIGEGIIFPCIDTLYLEALQLSAPDSTSLMKKLFRRKPKISVRLPECRERYHLPHYPAHNALTDAQACAELFQAQVAHHFTPETAIGTLWC